jgi:hypothetical protein
MKALTLVKPLAPVAIAALTLALMSSEASAWYCRAVGYGGSGWGRSDSHDRAKYIALYQCSRMASSCRIRTCVP